MELEKAVYTKDINNMFNDNYHTFFIVRKKILTRYVEYFAKMEPLRDYEIHKGRQISFFPMNYFHDEHIVKKEQHFYKSMYELQNEWDIKNLYN